MTILLGLISFLGISLVAILSYMWKKQIGRIDYHAQMLMDLGHRLDRVEGVRSLERRKDPARVDPRDLL